eukprot:CAMPEP_0201487798 /NCGR_PEP_ID=MMETSP0151_2-20130828/15360_1 /ASSEMBLY_ACC=CAM_ASM_000257 /TAXON_ID=200890 /ORGANISM="Paramoeba atlantica, Strain 621/1 / CCAP 1560/9" /LENGTH=126 /DNA_ID=CAMNT_0047872947 /DNA_START=1080 /DNA_END=1460 /DNA_ORIENTATION=-
MQQLLWDPIDFSGINKNVPLRYVPIGFDNAIEAIENDPNPDRFFRCQYDDLVKDPIAMVKKIYEHFDVDYTQNYNQVLTDFASRDQRSHSKKVKHNYTLSDFGMTEQDVLDAYKNYIKFGKFDDPK